MSKTSHTLSIRDAVAILNPGGSIKGSAFSSNGRTFVSTRTLVGVASRLVRVFHDDGWGFKEMPMLTSPNTNGISYQMGESVSLSPDGRCIAVGTLVTEYAFTSYRVRVYLREGVEKIWVYKNQVELSETIPGKLYLSALSVSDTNTIYADKPHANGVYKTRFNIEPTLKNGWVVTGICHITGDKT